MQPIPYNMKWAARPDGSGVSLVPLTPEELAAAEQQARPAPNIVGAPPIFLDDNENIYKDKDGVIRNMKQGTPSQQQMGRQPSAYAPSPSSSGGSAPAAAGGGDAGFGRGSGPSYTGSIRTQYSGSGGGGSGGGGSGGGMPIMQDTRMSSALDPSLWNTPVTGGSVNQSAGQAGGYANALANLNPSVGAPDRTLYDRYSALLQDPTMGMSNPASQFALREAQQANQRQLSAGRMRNSGNALRAMSDVTTGTLMQQFGNLANIYGQGAGMEGQRWQQEQALGLDAQKLKLAGLQGAGDLAVRSGALYGQQDDSLLRARQLDLERSKANILTPNQAQTSQVYSQAVQQANASPYGSYSPSLSQQYLSLTGTPLSLSYTPGSGGLSSSSYGFSAPQTTPGYWR